MAYFDQHPNLVRFLIGLLTVLLFIFAGINFYRYASSPTDENLFTNSPSKLYVVKNITGVESGRRQEKTMSRPGLAQGDSIRVGDLVLLVNEKRPASPQELESIAAGSTGDTINVTVNRPAERADYFFRVRKSSLTSTIARVIPPTADVVDVTEGGASDRAGMKVGDLIVRINGKGFDNVLQADSIMRQGHIGKSIEYEVLRENRLLTLNVVLASLGFPFSFLVVFCAGLLYMGTGAFLSLKRPQLNAARLAGLALLLLGFFILTTYAQRDSVVDLFARVRGVVTLFAVLLGIAIFYHSGHYFPKERPELVARPWLRLSTYGIALVGATATMIFKGNVGLISLFVIILWIVVVVIYYRKQSSTEYRQTARIINWTSLCSAALTIAFGYLANTQQAVIYVSLMGVTLAAIPLAYLYSVGRYHLLDIDLRVRRNIQYSIISWAWVLLLAAASLWILINLPQVKMDLPNIRLTGTSIEVLKTPSLPGEQEPIEKALLMAIAALLTVAVAFVGRKGQEGIDKLYDRARYDYRRSATELAELMGTTLGMVDLARGIVKKLVEIIRLKRAGILFFRDEQNCCCTEAQGFDGTSWKEFCLQSDKKIIEVIQRFRGGFSVDYLPPGIKEKFVAEEFHYVVPVRSKERLIGALCIGEKLSESTFSQEDLEILTSTSKQASVAIENAFLYEELAEQERIKHELDIARRIQEGLLPKRNPAVKGLDISGISIPAMSVGGDYFDFIQLGPKKLLVVVADVSGKGMSAALYMSKIQGMVQLAAHMYKTPKEMLVHINRRIFEGLERKSFITMILAYFDLEKKEVRICRAGHNKALIKTDGHLKFLSTHGIGLGLERGKIFEEELQEVKRPLRKDDIYVFYTDGLTEAMDEKNNQFGEETVHHLVEVSWKYRSADLQESILSSVRKFRGAMEPHDDLTLVVVKTTPS